MYAPTNQPVRRSDIGGEPVRVRWSLDDLVTLDGHRITAAFSASLRALPDLAERKLFDETFLRGGSTFVAMQDIQNHFTPALRSAAAALVNKESAETALSDAFGPRWIEALRATADKIAFSCGIELLAPFDIEVNSPSLQQERLEQMQRTIAERKAADRVEHFQRAAELLRQWEALRASAPTITPGDLLGQVNPSDRGAMLETLIMASAKQGKQPDLWAVAGPNLVRIDVSGQSPQAHVIALPTTAGPLRSVRIHEGRVLVGARNGVMVVDAENPASVETYLDPELNSEFGFTRVISDSDRIWGCHRDGGIVGWNLGKFDRPRQVLRPPDIAAGKDVKFLTRDLEGSRLLFASESRVLRYDPSSGRLDTLATASAPIVALIAADHRLIVVSDDGTVAFHDRTSLERLADTRPAGRLAGAAIMPWLSSSRILLSTADGPICCVGLDDQLTTQFTGPYVGFRAVTGSAGRVAAMTPDRQRVVLWNSWDGRRPCGEIFLTGLTRHRVADISFDQA